GAQIARLHALFEAISLAIAIFDHEQRLVSANARFRELTGMDDRQALGRSIYDAFPNALADLTEQIDNALEGRPVVAYQVAFQHRGGTRVVEATFAPLAEPGTLGSRGIVFAGNDITEREELRESLARSVSQLETIFDVIPDSVRVVDMDGRTLRSNTQAQQDHAPNTPSTLRELWQLDRPKTLDGTSLFMHEHPTARALRGERVRGETLSVRRGPENQVIIEVNANPLYDERGRIRGAVTVERDVTFRVQLTKKLEEEARRTAELYERVSTEAERLERMVQERTREVLALQDARARERRLAAVGQLAAGVMHDVNNALNPIMAAAYLLEANASNPTAVRDYAVRIAKAAETGAATAARVGRFIRQEPLQGVRDEVVDLSTICDEVVAMTRPLWAERARGGQIQLRRVLANGATVRGIAGELREALLNLVQNALDAMQTGGTLGIHTDVIDDIILLEVSDSGIGMSAEVRERAFEPFFTTKGQMGTGLGLAEVYGIVKRHRGEVELESQQGQGTTVRMRYPRATPPAVDQQKEPPKKKVTRRVLLVEDHNDSREFMTALLETEGHQVTSAASVKEALERLNSPEGEKFEVLVTDIGLPDASGWDLIPQARELRPSLRIGVVTGWEGHNAPSEGADFLLRKPIRTSEFLTQVAGEA
ncbi:MAG TPA: PAS domain-containing protein, partial [Gemmatimonadaceae bacterium]|nr:PAS domain-containing protein [Gemmatimonadaceae bacterium]